MYSGVPINCVELGEQRLLGQPLLRGLGDAEVDHLRHRLAVVERDQDVGRLDVAVDDALLVRVLDRLADVARTAPAARGCDSCVRRSTAVIGTPLTSSMTKYGRPVSVAPASNTLAMFGWSIIASACRSASNRAMTSLVSMPGLMIFSATRRRTGSAARPSRPCPCRLRRASAGAVRADTGADILGGDGMVGGRRLDGPACVRVAATDAARPGRRENCQRGRERPGETRPAAGVPRHPRMHGRDTPAAH